MKESISMIKNATYYINYINMVLKNKNYDFLSKYNMKEMRNIE